MYSATALSKRKRVEDVTTLSENSTAIGVMVDSVRPVGSTLFVSFPSTEPPVDATFLQYKTLTDVPSAPVNFIHASTSNAEYSSTIQGIDSEPGRNSQYFMGIYDRDARFVHLRPASLCIVTEEIMALKPSQAMEANAGYNWWNSRKALGMAFGNAGARKAIREAEARQIDARAVRSTIDALQSSIDNATSSLLYPEFGGQRPYITQRLPAYDISAKDYSDAYPLSGTVPQLELDAIDVAWLEPALHNHGAVRLPYRSKWARQLLARNIRGTRDLQILLYICYLISFKNYMQSPRKRHEIVETLEGIPPLTLDGILKRFAEQSRDSKSLLMTLDMTVKIINYILVLCLRLENWQMELSPQLMEDLKLDDMQMSTHLRSIGCKISTKRVLSQDLQGLGVEAAHSVKTAELRAPLTFPNPKEKVGLRRV